MVTTYRARRRIQMPGLGWREPGEPLPEAAAWLRVDSYEHTGYIVKEQVEEADFRAAIALYCPEQNDWLCELAGLNADVVLEGPHGTPRRVRAKKLSTAKPELISLKD